MKYLPLLALAALIAAVLLIVPGSGKQPSVAGSIQGAVVTESTLTELGTLDPGKVRSFVRAIDRLMDTLEPSQQAASDFDMMLWTYEILPFFEYERVRNNPVVPDAVTMTPYLSGTQHNHILGRAHCAPPDEIPGLQGDRKYPFNVELNMRLENYHSAWFNDVSYLPVLIHELAHIQGACGSGASAEHTAQIVTVEILSALTLGGNREALYPLLDEIRGWGMSYLLYDAINLNTGSRERLDEYRAFRATIYDDAFEISRAEKSLRFWDSNSRSELASILHTYSVTPLVLLFEGAEAGRVPLVIPEFQRTREHGPSDYRGRRDFEIDDFVALLGSVEALVAQLAAEQSQPEEA